MVKWFAYTWQCITGLIIYDCICTFCRNRRMSTVGMTMGIMVSSCRGRLHSRTTEESDIGLRKLYDLTIFRIAEDAYVIMKDNEKLNICFNKSKCEVVRRLAAFHYSRWIVRYCECIFVDIFFISGIGCLNSPSIRLHCFMTTSYVMHTT